MNLFYPRTRADLIRSYEGRIWALQHDIDTLIASRHTSAARAQDILGRSIAKLRGEIATLEDGTNPRLGWV